MVQHPIVVIVGPTATGKTDLAIALARQFGGEIVSADSRQIYCYMNIGTAKPTTAQRAAAPHYLIDFVPPDAVYTVAQYQQEAFAAITALHHNGKLPILVGGTGLYIRAVVDGLAIPDVAAQPTLRREWEELVAQAGAAALHQKLQELDPPAAVSIPATNVRRVIRALEVCVVTGRPFSAQRTATPPPLAPLLLGLTAERAELYQRADARVDQMLAQGLVDEVRALAERGYSWDLPALSGLGYRQIGAYLRGEVTLAAAVARLKYDTHHYIRRQLVWFHSDRRIHWLDIATPRLAERAIQIVAQHLPAPRQKEYNTSQ
jgi:tRNA dimethylallyltransferase